MGSFLDPLITEYLDGVHWLVRGDFRYRLGSPTGAEFVDVPPMFITDFASVPKALQNILPPTGPYGKAAVIHDWLYRNRLILPARRLADKAEADHIFLEAMQVLGVGWWTRSTMYAGVRLGGFKSWNAYRDAERRLSAK